MLYIYIFGFCLTFSNFCKDDACFVISVQYIDTYQIGYLQFIKESLDLYALASCESQSNIFGFCDRYGNGTLFLAIPGDYYFVDEKAIFYYQFSILKVIYIVAVGIPYQPKRR